jgi:copper chaperone
MAAITVRVGGMTCDHCTMAIERAIALIEGVATVTADFRTGVVDVIFDGGSDETSVRDAIEEEGYDVLSVAERPA